MITSLTLTNFKSYANASMPLSSLSFLIGPNASGKSNALEAIRFLSWLAKGSRLDDIERSIQGGDALVRGQAFDLFKDKEVSIEIGCRFGDIEGGWEDLAIQIGLFNDQLVIVGESVTKPNEAVPLYRIDGSPSPYNDEISVMYNNFKRGRNKPHIPCSNRQAIFYQLETPGRFDKNHQDSQRIIPTVTKDIRSVLRSITFLDPRPASMRSYSYSNDDEVKEDGSNLSSVLYKLCQSGESKDQVLQFIKSLPEQDIQDIQFIETERKDVMVRLLESFGGKSRAVDAPLLSDGTLRVLAVAATLLRAEEGSLVIIEEIDNGVHPSRSDNLVQQIKKISQKRSLRVLLTSHNPALLDALPSESLKNVLYCYRDPEGGDSRIVRLGDLPRYPELVIKGPIGQLMTQRVLEYFIKDPSTPESRKEEAIQWFEKLAQGGDQ